MASRGDDLRDLLWRLSHPKRLGPAVFVLLAALLLPRFLAPHSRVCHALRKLYDVPSEPLDPPEPWDSSILAVLGASSTSRPVLFTTTDTALGATPCVARWRDPAHLTRLGGESLLTAWRHNSSEFMLARGQEARFTRSRAITRVNVTLNEFFAAAGETQPLLYSVGPLSSTLGDALQHEAAGIQSALAVSDAPSDHADASSWPSSATNVWLGHGGVLATTHYDPSHNVVLQLAGAKTWLLWPPESISALRLHPATHPSRRQTRAPLIPVEPPAGEEWGYEHAPALRVEMRAGDAIYVPPYWSHAVLATEASVSLSVISPSWIPAIWARHKAQELPFAAIDAPGAQRAAATGLYLRVLLPRVGALKQQSAREFVRAVYVAGHAQRGTAEAEHAAAQAGAARAMLGDLACDVLTSHPPPNAAELMPDAEKLEPAAAAVSSLLDTVHGGRHFTPAVARELLTGYVDELAAWAMGDAPSAAGLLACWAYAEDPGDEHRGGMSSQL